MTHFRSCRENYSNRDYQGLWNNSSDYNTYIAYYMSNYKCNTQRNIPINYNTYLPRNIHDYHSTCNNRKTNMNRKNRKTIDKRSGYVRLSGYGNI